MVVGRFCLSIYEVIRHGYFIGFHLLIWNVDTYTIDMWFVVVVVIVGYDRNVPYKIINVVSLV